ncbi:MULTISPECIES: FAD-dependent oxidoreductase [unclassified Mycobacterium]|uniref:NAD(P)/FAD-dependent oxidoreductase n=1 Tax=unclassified Mycobacterium TaxID=2642494 RepID=UPI00073FEA8A|nr:MULTISPECIES: FAD-dependent oxidoreductase [unclassified Mycobacterium]KUH81442.1 pyridine nucleotide-disulfide oxidoreductase [Mycobacterium sp. GA-0227b]KUH83572.1 pyridine nucleotide-disulfide oxidoreductase [Mycobacterium sp. GA-1999]KUH84656.1 pyridine nucleotide-disulfide oxidoreductase [Mycobacterium sp. IS-1556]
MVAAGFVAIGSGPAGVSAAETFRGKHPGIPVRILTTDPALPYAKPPLSKDFLCGRDTKLALHSEGWFERNAVDLIRGITVDSIDLQRQQVVTAGGQRYPYWHLVLASGSAAVRPAIPGIESALTLRSFADAVALKMAARYADCAVVIGGGLIGCEAASCLAAVGVATMVVAAEHVPLQRRFGLEAGERVAKLLSDNGVRFAGETTVAEIEDSRVVLDSGETVDADLVVCATGVRPDIRLAEAAGLDTHGGRIVVDEHMHTSARNVYAAGDVALAHNVTAGRRVPAEHWRDAAHQGYVAGLTAAGFPAAWGTVPGFACTIGTSVLKYSGWGVDYDNARFVDHHTGFAVWYEAGGDVVGVLTLDADDDYRRAVALLSC